MDVEIHWRGGFTSCHEVIRPVQLHEHLRDHAQLFDRLARLHREGYHGGRDRGPAQREGLPTTEGARGLHGDVGEEADVAPGAERRRKDEGLLGKDEWWVSDLARELRASGGKLRDWAGRGWLHARRVSAHGPWIIWADDRERERLRKLVTHSRRGVAGYPASMTRPRSKKKK